LVGEGAIVAELVLEPDPSVVAEPVLDAEEGEAEAEAPTPVRTGINVGEASSDAVFARSRNDEKLSMDGGLMAPTMPALQ